VGKTKLVIIILPVLIIITTAYADRFELAQATFVSMDGPSTDALYNYASAVPVSRYYADGHFYFSEIYTYKSFDPGSSENIKRLLVVGNVPGDYIGTTASMEEITYGGDDPVEIAAALSREWIKTDEIVLAVYDPEPTDAQILALKCAAEHAAYINAPLMYVTEDGAPGCTLLAGAGLGAKSAYLYDFGDNVDGSVKNTLNRAGFNLKADFKEYVDAISYEEDIKTAPNEELPSGIINL
jgi:hypothetical protein